MIKLTDEILMAYVDGELEKSKADEIRKAIEADPEALERIEIFRQSAAVLQGVYDAPLQEPVPERLIETVMGANRRKSVPGLLKWLADFYRRPAGWKFACATVFSLVLLIGVGIGYMTANNGHPRRNLFPIILNDRGFSRGLDTTISGNFFKTADNTFKVTPVLTFVDKVHHYCRLYEMENIRDQKHPLLQGIACRDKSGTWHTMVIIFSGPSAQLPTETDTQYIRAGASDLTDSITSSLMVTPPMTLEQEKKLIKMGWPEKEDK